MERVYSKKDYPEDEQLGPDVIVKTCPGCNSLFVGNVQRMICAQCIAESPYDSTWDTQVHIDTVQYYIGIACRDLFIRSANHDQSKLGPEEKPGFDDYTPKLKHMTYGSPEYTQCLLDLAPTLQHHYRNNSHHPEYHAYDDKGEYHPDWLINGYAISRMSLLDIMEMLADWIAATKRHADGDIYKSIDLNQKRFGYTDQFKQMLINTVPALLNTREPRFDTR